MAGVRAGEQAISDERVRERTGRSWKQWFALLDRCGAKSQSHREIAQYVNEKYSVGPWWSQAVTVRYEQDRGLRIIGERADGNFEVSVQKTIAVSRRRAFDAFTQARHWNKWFTSGARINLKVGGKYANKDHDSGVFLAIEPPERVRFTWENEKASPGTTVEVTFAPAADGKTAVRIQHMKLADNESRATMKQGWSWSLESLKSYLETGKPVKYEDWLKMQKSS